VLGFCGTWLPKKGIDVLITDVTRILREFADWRFLVLGTNPNDRVQDAFPEDLRERIEVVQMIGDKEALARQYERVEIFVLPSVIESFGIALAEAMACGCAPVANRVGFAATLTAGREAILLDRLGSPALYDAVKHLIENPALRQRIAEGAWQRVQSLRWDRAIETLSDAYAQWVAEHRHTC
jgi:glycosyltransferase involved in cell wall biosynthesis